MYLKYKCIVPARFARRIYFLGTYNLGAHSLCISSSVFFPKEQTICWLQTCPIIPVALHLSSQTVWFSNLSSFFIGRVFFLHLMSFSSEYFRWYKTTCSQNAFLGNYGNSIYFKIGLGFFFSRPLRCASRNSIRYCCSEEFLTRVENWFKVFFFFCNVI